MTLNTKKRFKNIGKVVAGVLFALLLFTNIKVALMDDAEIFSGDISLLGVELTLFEATYACGGADCYDICKTNELGTCTYLISVGWCPGRWR
ncbi:MAG: hypothetical protein KDC52_07410 [Ignavibacteriae bacterium]|nr:hypothetical protein [Ignavibacteriota bacterium]MCB0745940.1 hypothetical protein [Ignavibacteriota bacterium]MCB0751284.1 hypothetical protein [Ignavibacteriota bacterium]MCB9250780.1 hypothetical protein [Ignavibacteriales bacterium]